MKGKAGFSEMNILKENVIKAKNFAMKISIK